MTDRKTIITDSTKERIVESANTIKSTLKLSAIENQIFDYLQELYIMGKVSKGFQHGIKKLNSNFVEWENGKSTVKTKVFPTVKNWENACKKFYLNCNTDENSPDKFIGIFPLVKVNSDGAIIVEWVNYDVNFYKIYTPKQKEQKEQKEFDLIDILENLKLLDSVSTEEMKILSSAIVQIEELRKKNSAVLHKSA